MMAGFNQVLIGTGALSQHFTRRTPLDGSRLLAFCTTAVSESDNCLGTETEIKAELHWLIVLFIRMHVGLAPKGVKRIRK